MNPATRRRLASRQVFAAGFAARLRGEAAEVNPYSEDVSEETIRDAFAAWRDGWEAANERPDVCPVRYRRAADSITEALIR